MEAYLKRKIDGEGDEDSNKKVKIEECPHGVKCYRRNPHHFKLFDHKHLNDLLPCNGDITIPPGYPHGLSTLKEQLDVLKSIKKTLPIIKPRPSKQIATVTANNKLAYSKVNENSKIEVLSSSDEDEDIIVDSPKSDGNNRIEVLSSSDEEDKVIPLPSASCSNNKNSINYKPSSSKKLVKTTKFIPTSTYKVVDSNIGWNMQKKWENAAPYHLFFTKIPDSPPTLYESNAISFTDLLCPSLGELKCSIQINFMIDIMWLMEQYNAQKQGSKPLTIIYGYEFPKMKEYIQKSLPNVKHHLVKMKDPFGTHHSKIGFYLYNDNSLRIVVSTANLYYEDWNYYNQGVWISPKLPKISESAQESDGIGPTGFKTTLLTYLKHYNLPCLNEWIDHIKKADFSEVKVFLVTSVPGKHFPLSTGSHVHSVRELLSRHCNLPAKTTPQSEGPLAWGILAQASSIGSLGKKPAEWLRSVFLSTLSCHKQGTLALNTAASLSIVYPSVVNVMSSFYGADGGGCLPYSKAIHEKQKWLHDYLYQWKANKLQRSRAMPHIKTYCRVSPCLTKLAWFLLTSANISRAAWGGNIQKDSSIYIRSYEVGVMFFPNFFDQDYFHIVKQGGSDTPLFPFIYDLPLSSYKKSDYPWCN